MGLHGDFDDSQSFSDMGYEPDINIEDEAEDLSHKRQVRKMLEDRLEKKRLKEEFRDEFSADDEFDWGDDIY